MHGNKLTAWLLVLAMVLTLTGCNPPADGTSNPDGHKRPASLMTADEVFQTLDGGYHEYFEPKDGGYGQLVPYVGRVEMYEIAETDEITYFSWWGLCTADGYAVTDAVYTAIEWYELENGNAVFELREQDVDAMMAGEDDYTDRGWIIAQDGSWMIECGDRAYLYSTSNYRMVVTTYTDPVWYRFYDYDGKAVGQLQAKRGQELSLQPFSGGYAYVEHWSAEHGETVGYYINRKGDRVFTNDFVYGDSFENGKAVACIVGEQYGILNENGTWFVEPKYGHITRTDNYFVLSDGSGCTVIDTNGHEWRRLENTTHVSLVVGKRVLYSTDHDDSLRYLDSGERVINDKTRTAVTIYDTFGDTFLTTHDKKEHRLYLLDYDGHVINEIPDFKHVAGYDDHYLSVYSYSDENRLQLINLSDGTQRLSTYGYAYATPIPGWYCIDDGKGNYTLRNMSNSEQIRFPHTELLVQKFGGKIYYQTFNTEIAVLMNDTMTPIVKLKNK